MKKILVIGAAGRLGSYFGQHYQSDYQMLLTDIVELGYEVGSSHEYRRLDITNLDEMKRACEGIHTVVHLAADPSMRATFYGTLLNLNVIGLYNAFDAAAEQGCKRMVYASSVNAVRGYLEKVHVTEESLPNPMNVYGACKVFGEALGRSFLHTHGLECFCMRFGGIRPDDSTSDPDQPASWITKRDAAHLVARCIDVEGVDYAIVHGFSRHVHCPFDISRTCESVGFEPIHGTATQ